MSFALRRVGRFLGRRGAFLLAMGLAWICYGAAILLTPAPLAQLEGLTILCSLLSLTHWGWIWVAAGAIGVAFCGVQRVGRDQLGFTALVLPTGAWATGYLADWIVVGDYSRGWVVASTYAGVAAAIVIASGWPEVRPRRYVKHE